MAEQTKFMAWVTKYALTDGILKMQVEDCFDTSPDMVKKANGTNQFFHGKDWHRTPEAAVTRAEQMRKAKLASIDRQRERIAALNFLNDLLRGDDMKDPAIFDVPTIEERDKMYAMDWADRLGIKCAHPAGADQCAGCPHYHDPKKYPECSYTIG